MTTLITDGPETAKAPAHTGRKTGKKPTASERRAQVALTNAKSGKTPSSAKKARKSGEKADSARDGSKTDQILNLLKQPGGVTSKELMKTTGLQPHSVRGFLSGTVGKKMDLAVTSTKGEDGQRRYSVKA